MEGNDGGSMAFDPWGEPAATEHNGILCVEADQLKVHTARKEYPFLQDA